MEPYQLEKVIINHMVTIEIGKLYRLLNKDRILPVFDRMPYTYPSPTEDHYITIYENRLIDWYDPTDKEWGYCYSCKDLRPGEVILVLAINERVQHSWAVMHRANYVAIHFLQGERSGWLYHPITSDLFELIDEKPL